MRYHRGHVALTIGLFLLMIFATPASAQDNDITNEYRTTLVTSKPVSDKVVLFTLSRLRKFAGQGRQDALLFASGRDLQTKAVDGAVGGIIRAVQRE